MQRQSPGALGINPTELEALFGLIESAPLRRLVARQAREVRLVEHARAHNIAIVLSGVGSGGGIRCGMCWSLVVWGMVLVCGVSSVAWPCSRAGQMQLIYVCHRHVCTDLQYCVYVGNFTCRHTHELDRAA